MAIDPSNKTTYRLPTKNPHLSSKPVLNRGHSRRQSREHPHPQHPSPPTVRRKMAIGPHPPQSTTTTKAPTAKQSHVHPHISQSHDPDKGRQLHATAPLKAGDVLIIDSPYAVIPVVDDPAHSDEILCSNGDCRRKVPRVRRIGCSNRCAAEVFWCDAGCRDADRIRHVLECEWLKGYAMSLRKNEGEYYFGVLWLIVRVLAARYVEKVQGSSRSISKERFSSGWTAMTELCDNRKLWPEADLLHWQSLIEKFICADSSLRNIVLSADIILTLICQQESNSFGLYPKATGLASTSDRGEQYGAAIYPRSSIANHSCCPNVSPVTSLDGE